MPRDSAIVVIGATGFTGTLIAHELAGRGEPFVIAARDPGRLKRLSSDLGDAAIPQRVDVTDRLSLDRLIRAGDAVINCAGPFTELGEPVIRACLAAGAHYFDTTGEQPFMREVHARYHEEAVRAGVAIVNGMAFEYALGDCAVAMVAGELGSPLRSLDVIYAWGGTTSSRGTRRTGVRMLARRGWQLEHGRWKRRPQGTPRRRVTMASGLSLHAVGFAAGEVVTAPRYLDVPTVRGWLVIGRTLARVAPLVAPALPVLVPPLRPLLDRIVSRQPDPTPEERDEARFTIRVEAEAEDGRRRAAEVQGRDAYGVTAAIAVAGADRARADDRPRADDRDRARAAPGGVLAPSQLVEPGSFLDSLAPRGIVVVADEGFSRNGTASDG